MSCPHACSYIPYKVRVILCVKFELCSIYLIYGWLFRNKHKNTHTKRNTKKIAENYPFKWKMFLLSLDKKAVRILISFLVHCAKHMTRHAVPKKSPPDFKSARNQAADAIPSWRLWAFMVSVNLVAWKQFHVKVVQEVSSTTVIFRSLLA